MSNRKNKVIIIFSIMLIAMNLFALTQTAAIKNDKFDGNMDSYLPASTLNNDLPKDNPVFINSIPSLRDWDLKINVTRWIELHDFGYITVNDNYTIVKNDNTTLPLFRFAIPNEMAVNLVQIDGGSNWKESGAALNSSKIDQEYKDEQFTYYVMQLNPPVTNNSEYIVQVHQTYLRPYEIYKVVDDQENLRNGIRMAMSGVPFLTVKIVQCRTTFVKPDKGDFIEDDISPVEFYNLGEASVMYDPYNNIPAFNFTKTFDMDSHDYRISFGAYVEGLNAPAEATYFKRTVIIDNWYQLKIHEEVTIRSYTVTPDPPLMDIADARVYAPFSLQQLYFYIDNVKNIDIYDEFGSLPPRTGEELSQINRFTVNLRVPLYGEQETTFYTDYNLDLEEHLFFEKNEFLLETLALPRVEFHVANFELEVIFPVGSNFQYTFLGGEDVEYTESKTPVFLRIGNRDTITITKTNVTQFDNLQFVAGYYMSDLAYFIQPMTFALIIFVACLVYVGARVLRKDVIEKVVITAEDKEEVPIELIQDFVEKYEEKTALQTRISNLDEDRRRKKIKAKEYDQQRKILEAKMRDTIKSLEKTKAGLKAQGRKYRDAIQKIEVSEEKRLSVERSINDLRIRYIREKAISKDAYIRILKDYRNQIERFDRDIDREIINLRLLIEHEQR